MPISQKKRIFAEKLRTLIQELVERLQAEAGNDQDHDRWCKKQTDKATQQRELKAEEIRSYNQHLAKGEANRDELNEDIKTLDEEIKLLEKKFDEAKKIREEEKAENAQAVLDGDEGKAAVTDAIVVLQKHYDAAADNEVALLDQEPPEAGFKNDEAYKGAQGAASVCWACSTSLRATSSGKKSKPSSMSRPLRLSSTRSRPTLTQALRQRTRKRTRSKVIRWHRSKKSKQTTNL